ncbi:MULTISPECIES: VOC family protein [Lysobacter]|uniref:VOC family protein n=1 Tax=Lysobacter firmicutimachus TaxID=1792846 RepID=A0ABU8D2J8_9GAMM|nr:VOC family protein [Lysobacter antibioticus]
MHRSRFAQLVIDCETTDPDWAAQFWAQALGCRIHRLHSSGDAMYRQLLTHENQPCVLVQAVEHASRMHLDIETDDVEAEVVRLEQLGAARIAQVKQWWVMAAPTGQRFCVLPPQRPDFPAHSNVWR